MILRALTLASGVAGAAATSQFPEYSQQYIQRLGGAVDELAVVVADFDTSAKAVGLTRESALNQMQGTDFLERRRTDMMFTFGRYDRLRGDLSTLEGQGPFMRAYAIPRLVDAQISAAVWRVYQPAVPLNLAGLIFGIVGFILGGAIIGSALRIITWPMRRRA